jgi:hypothetical protein
MNPHPKESTQEIRTALRRLMLEGGKDSDANLHSKIEAER